MNWFIAGAVGGIKVQVRESDAERAIELLAGSRELKVEEKEDELNHCPECDSEKVRHDGVKVSCIVTATPFRAPNGKLIGIVEKNGKSMSCIFILVR